MPEKRSTSRASDLTRQDAAKYTREMLDSLSKIARSRGMPVLSILIDRAIAEAAMQIDLTDDESKLLGGRDGGPLGNAGRGTA